MPEGEYYWGSHFPYRQISLSYGLLYASEKNNPSKRWSGWIMIRGKFFAVGTRLARLYSGITSPCSFAAPL